MNTTTRTQLQDIKHENGVLVMTRAFDAPCDLVFDAWEHFANGFDELANAPITTSTGATTIRYRRLNPVIFEQQTEEKAHGDLR